MERRCARGDAQSPLARGHPAPLHAALVQGLLHRLAGMHGAIFSPQLSLGPAVRRRSSGSGRSPAFLLSEGGLMSSMQADIEARLAAAEPQVEVLLAEVVGGDTLRLFIDHPDGVSLDLCERVTHQLGEFRE